MATDGVEGVVNACGGASPRSRPKSCSKALKSSSTEMFHTFASQPSQPTGRRDAKPLLHPAPIRGMADNQSKRTTRLGPRNARLPSRGKAMQCERTSQHTRLAYPTDGCTSSPRRRAMSARLGRSFGRAPSCLGGACEEDLDLGAPDASRSGRPCNAPEALLSNPSSAARALLAPDFWAPPPRFKCTLAAAKFGRARKVGHNRPGLLELDRRMFGTSSEIAPWSVSPKMQEKLRQCFQYL